MPVLLKTQGKTTTDHISPAGPWLRFRGHLDKFSDNMFMGATNAWTGERGKSGNMLTGKAGQSVADSARSFVRIHESNLKKQDLLALTFQDPANYERIREDDRIDLVGLSGIAPGKPVQCRIAHAHGTAETLMLYHSFSAPQLEWFRAGTPWSTAAVSQMAMGRACCRNCCRSRPGGAPNSRLYSRLNCDGLS